MKFPAHFPAQCPPGTSFDATGELFRFVDHKPPEASDFVSNHLLGKKYEKAKHCQACGLSILTCEADVQLFLKAVPYFRKKFVAKGTVSPDWGKMEQTGRAPHHTWWVPDGKNPETIFAVIETS